MKIDDGTGTGFQAKVNTGNRLEVQSVTRSEHLQATEEGRSYYFSTGHIALTTTASYTGLLYIKNNSATNLHLYSIRTCGEVLSHWQFTKNPTTGTLISGAVDGGAENADFTSANIFTGDVFKGADGNTITDGVVFQTTIQSIGHSTLEPFGALVLKPGNSISIEVKPSASGDVCVSVLGYYEDDDSL